MEDVLDDFDFDALCEKVFKLDDKIRSASVINNKGKVIAGKMRPDLKPLGDPRKEEMLFMELSLMMRMRHEYDEEFGLVEFAVSHREKVVLLTFLVGKNVLFVSTEKQVDLNKIPFKIIELTKS